MANTPGKGTVLQLSIASVFTTIAQGVRIQGPQRSNPPIDDTILTDTRRSFIGSIVDEGEVTFVGNWDASATTHASLNTDFVAGTIGSWKIIFADAGAADVAFSAFITAFNIGEATLDNLVTVEITLRIDGAITITP